MGFDWAILAAAVALLMLAAPYVAWVRHPQQKPFAAYLIFVTVFSLACVVLFVVLGWVLSGLGLERWLGPWGIGSILLIFGVLPALVIATWQARQPPMDRGRPD
jgi:hypothetical protein